MTAPETSGGWAVLIPVKPTAIGKSRLDLPGADRVTLARAIALDTIAATAACPAVAQVFVVTDDGALVALAFDIAGLRFVSEDDGTSTARGIDAAIAVGAAAAGDGMPRAALLGDLPALRPEDLELALTAASGIERAVVADAEGTGTTLVTARPGTPLRTAFGAGSFGRHIGLGCVPLTIPEGSTLRRDVDTVDQLEAAAALGVGPRTSRVLRAQTSR
ncbi:MULTISPECIES: 2-phospho-L-lactate guanylyltransferase [unclassified Microbacterium]|uniref:2-phospho-L-lactate guanylyltransferase n=1 Tax=unclassified Microbacterium TaxID=2609290 RepID=UPI00214CC9CF|nr:MULTISPECIES: 2-phospho-L-lactate guanylyltransferase [unclassified Microbacterium]MCR2808578.1 2-phospho-L-lactate guanylyltransferase [Microbacterium sp. zg.B185]WIM18984.1 2-phospho-L-lactate guanylyltransferase [Microbacterium sp. zg-B185]